MIEFRKYAEVKDNYCLCYFGYSDEYLVQLRLLKPILERQFPGLHICFGCKDDKVDLLSGCGAILTISKVKVDRNNYAHIREIRYNGRTHPIEDLLQEAEIENATVVSGFCPPVTRKCVLITKGSYPTKSLQQNEIEQIEHRIKKEHFDIEQNVGITNASLVVGVESPELFEAAGQGIRTILVPTGIGTNLYRKMFPQNEVWSPFG